MNTAFKKIIKRLQSIRMTDAEKALGRSRLLDFISFNPIRGEVSVPRERRYISIFSVGHFVKATALVLIIGIVATGSGVSYAASSALPGEKLYNVKVNVNEKIEDKLAFSNESKVAVQSKKVERRLEEAQALAKDNKLSSQHTKTLTAKLEEHIGELEKEIQDLKDEGEVDVVLEATSKIAPVLEVHKDILIEQSKEDSGDDEGKSTTLIAVVETSIEKMAAEESDALLIASNISTDTNAAASLMMASDVSIDTSSTEDTTVMSKEKTEEPAETLVETRQQDTASIVNVRINSAKARLRALKEDSIKDRSETSSTADKTTAVKVVQPVDEKATITTKPAPIEIEQKVIETQKSEEVTDPTIAQTTSPAPFDLATALDEAYDLVESAEDLANRNRYDEALTTIQRAHHIISSIETYQKIKLLEIAQASTVTTDTEQKASAADVLKEKVDTSLIK